MQIEQFGYSYVAAQVCARSVALLQLVSLLLLLVNHFLVCSFLGLAKSFWFSGLLPARASEQGNVIGSVRIYIYIYIYVYKKKL